ncbi:MAG: glycosyltransferase [Chloroflexi bacterium]|nr:glycosyltransferase [Chloroflexota bacterium]
MLILALVALASLALGAAVLRVRTSLGALRAVTPGPLPEPAPRVSILVPARNEAANIVACLRSLLAQDYPRFEVIVLDDQSTDGTGELVAQLAGADRRLRLLQGQPLPAGWTGKNFALAQAAALARGDWLLFTDADTLHEPQTLTAALSTAERRGLDFLSLATGQVLGGVWERLVVPVVAAVVGLATPVQAVNDPKRTGTAFALGQFILIRRRAYEGMGGHAAVRAEILEDCELARLAKQAGFALLLADGRALVRARMYRGFRDLWEGWTKNAFLGPGGRVSIALGGLAFITLLGVGPFAAWALAAIAVARQPLEHDMLLLGLASLHLVVLLCGWSKVCRGFQVGWPYPLALPVGALVLDAILINSAYRHLAGRGVAWKGRRYGRESGTRDQRLGVGG